VDNIIFNPAHSLSMAEITDYFDQPFRGLWVDLNTFLQEKHKIKPKIQFSHCAGNKGWNIKYQKSGKSVCTLYPEKSRFLALVVIPQKLASEVETQALDHHPLIVDLVKNTEPFQNSLWLMVPITTKTDNEALKALLEFKLDTK
jgi:hypothetical protein